jgi:hypothetical protein
MHEEHRSTRLLDEPEKTEIPGVGEDWFLKFKRLIFECESELNVMDGGGCRRGVPVWTEEGIQMNEMKILLNER